MKISRSSFCGRLWICHELGKRLVMIQTYMDHTMTRIPIISCEATGPETTQAQAQNSLASHKASIPRRNFKMSSISSRTALIPKAQFRTTFPCNIEAKRSDYLCRALPKPALFPFVFFAVTDKDRCTYTRVVSTYTGDRFFPWQIFSC